MDEGSVSRERLVEIGRELCELGGLASALTVKRQANAALAPAVHGAVMHCIELGEAALDVFDSGRDLAAMPLMRAAYESGLTAAWLAQNPEAIRGLVNENRRQRRALSDAMSKSVSESFRDGASKIAHINEDKIETSADAQAQYIKQMCSALRGGHDAYLYYRFMSSLSHTSAMVIDHYVEETDSNERGVILLKSAKPQGHDAWLFLTVASMMWALHALDHLDITHTRRSRLQRYARELGVTAFLSLTPEAATEAAKAEQDRRRSQWKGKRPKLRQTDGE